MQPRPGRVLLSQVIEQRRRNLGDLEVGRVLPAPGCRMVGPFVFLDHIGPVTLPAGLPASADVRPHPHIGLATVTYLFNGEIMHRDSVGAQQAIRAGDVNWMVAGRGITHSERFEKARASGDQIHGIQTWVALPTQLEEIEPEFEHHPGAVLPQVSAPGLTVRVIAGRAYGHESPVNTHSPLFYAHAQLAPDAQLRLPEGYPQRAVYVAAGQVEYRGESHNAGRLLVFAEGSDEPVKAVGPATLMLLGGDPVGPRHIEWNFVSSTLERIEQAKADWRAGRFKLPDYDREEFIPLPEDQPAR
jgi:redox-sensitive bicupin YhaK (pirin superfamily)